MKWKILIAFCNKRIVLSSDQGRDWKCFQDNIIYLLFRTYKKKNKYVQDILLLSENTNPNKILHSNFPWMIGVTKTMQWWKYGVAWDSTNHIWKVLKYNNEIGKTSFYLKIYKHSVTEDTHSPVALFEEYIKILCIWTTADFLFTHKIQYHIYYFVSNLQEIWTTFIFHVHWSFNWHLVFMAITVYAPSAKAWVFD